VAFVVSIVSVNAITVVLARIGAAGRVLEVTVGASVTYENTSK
jgi:hypothetical protein